jgi:hypothetical protein
MVKGRGQGNESLRLHCIWGMGGAFLGPKLFFLEAYLGH